MVTVAVIFIMLLLVYRSIITVVLLLITVGVELTAARGVVAVLGHSGAIGLTTFAVSLLTSLAIAAGTDYGIFIIGATRKPPSRRGQRGRLLHHVPRDRPRDSGLWIDHRRSYLLPELCPHALLSNPGIPCAWGC